MIDSTRNDWKTWRLFALVAIAAALMGGRPGAAAELAERDARLVQQVVQAQLAAFAADDAEQAFSYAAPGIRARFGSAAEFMAMVRAGYPMVIRPAAAAFFIATAADGVVIQKVHLRNVEGAGWMAVYQLQRDGEAWRIVGVAVLPENGQSTFL